MGNLLRSQRRQLKEWVEALEDGSFNGDSKAEVERIKGLLGEWGAASNSEYYARLDNLNGKAIGDSDIEFTQGKRKYIGLVDDKITVVTPVYGHMFIERYYAERFKLSWRFNQKGRIDMIDSMLYPDLLWHLVTVKNFQSIEPGWAHGYAFHTVLPRDLAEFLPGFESADERTRYDLVMKSGHRIAADICSGLERNSIKRPAFIGRDKAYLGDIAEDDEAAVLLQRASMVKPRVARMTNSSERGQLVINYS
ncbi:hypothetical protein CO038_01710 [Candidatus Pacearchaeota archaeon CG_4_9_14_0_2_um_filter_39_13]|nr:hypothetical protein [Candidatus Pacearchaeota archaeon]OIO42472.1 MAG: hypothetical protein AUJ64_04155 [Candidatus Pacearchaeota archaeon CG1_02_39_14]PJC44845.1 MAG: hypothetical protein CO038_01710 [Candidatus Pacearchaeota archaeon CG_4_9_14_0_2_um_filter_39_13]